MIEIVPATREMVQSWYGETPKTVRAIAALDGEKVVGVAGYFRDSNCMQVFVALSDELKKRPKVIVLGARKLLGELSRKNIPVRAFRDANQPTSEAFLNHFGFQRLEGEVFQWQQ